METGIVVALVGLLGGGITAVTSILINRLNRKDSIQDKNSISTNDLYSIVSPLKDMCVASVRDKLRHYASKYLADSDKATIVAVKDWLDLETQYEKNGGNSHIQALRPKMEELLQELEIREQQK